MTADSLGISNDDLMTHGDELVQVVNIERVFLSSNMITVKPVPEIRGVYYYVNPESLTSIYATINKLI